jgi:hypothetical protein
VLVRQQRSQQLPPLLLMLQGAWLELQPRVLLHQSHQLQLVH